MIDRPMKAARAKSLEDIALPALCTPKVDGIRCLTIGGKAWSKTFKRIPNVHIRRVLAELPDGLDGELVAGDFSETQSAVMSGEGEPAFEYHVFDTFANVLLPYEQRMQLTFEHPVLHVVTPTLVSTIEELAAYEEAALAAGWEGICTRSPGSPYKEGRSTLREQYLVKYKRFCTGEARVVGFEEAKENCNPQVPNAFGLMKRPGGAALKLPKNTLGNLLLVDLAAGFSFSCGTGDGLTHELRDAIWRDRPSYLGKVVKYKYQGLGSLGRPRFPVLLGFRDERDV